MRVVGFYVSCLAPPLLLLLLLVLLLQLDVPPQDMDETIAGTAQDGNGAGGSWWSQTVPKGSIKALLKLLDSPDISRHPIDWSWIAGVAWFGPFVFQHGGW